MTDQTAMMLEWFANYSNFYSILSILVCFCAMVVFILRLNGEHLMGSSATHYNVVREQKMVSLHNPFSVQLSGSRLSSVKDGLYLDVSVTQQTSVRVFWGVNIQAFQRELSCPTSNIAAHFRDEKLFNNSYVHMTDLGSLSPRDQLLEMSVQCPDCVTEAVLGEPPRQVYPVVSVSLLDDVDIPQDSTSIVVQFTVFHLKDSVCTLDSHIVYQFVKNNHNKVLSLQPIFLVSSDPDTNDSSSGPAPDSPDTAASQAEDGASRYSPDTGTSQLCDRCRRNSYNGDMCGDNSSTRQQTYDASKPDSDESQDTCRCECHTSAGFDGDTDRGGVDDNSCCIVCQSAVIVYTLLPCRHACVCDACIKQLDRCPMCRGYFDAYFRLGEVISEQFEPEHSEPEDNAPALSRWQALNQRVNEFLGFS